MGSEDPPPDEKSIDDVYHDRNLLAIAFARLAAIQWPGSAGWYLHEGWPVIWVETPAGQTSWHVTPNLTDVLERSSLLEQKPEGGFDGHDRTTKNSRLARFVTGTYPTFL